MFPLLKKEIGDGVFLVNKPRGIASYAIVRRFKKIFPGEKVGHAGTLDPLAEGLLIILVGRATRRQNEFMELGKQYRAEAVFGVKSDTYDLEGKLTFNSKAAKQIAALNKEAVIKALDSFRPSYSQEVPLFSAIKVGGVPLYRLARGGERPVNLPRRSVKIKKILLSSFQPGKLGMEIAVLPKAELLMDVGKGFYVRSLINDLGTKLRVGAVVARLVRTKIGPYELSGITKGDTLANADQ